LSPQQCTDADRVIAQVWNPPALTLEYLSDVTTAIAPEVVVVEPDPSWP
jgi:hypothetical protein